MNRTKRTHKLKFTETEDNLLRLVIAQTGTENWHLVASRMGSRTARQCRDRWKHYLSPATNNNEWSEFEDLILVENFNRIGPHWGRLATLFPGRTSVGVRNRCCKLLRMRDGLNSSNNYTSNPDQVFNSSENSEVKVNSLPNQFNEQFKLAADSNNNLSNSMLGSSPVVSSPEDIPPCSVMPSNEFNSTNRAYIENCTEKSGNLSQNLNGANMFKALLPPISSFPFPSDKTGGADNIPSFLLSI
ncbi:hypothetical protein TRFO_06496 [Tritrichomonas foetus]|uniref:Myb-like DNA-binding domain containing protein n=1 Tax=Tritrichomonas foetus TaxID=1144522 RepID=A0A1J4K340_9EUKA|nr:hypothetical protein TRFO_06496 [Tritrichomonas foetus]|eukprot:OHT04164.1 hypothetical protein TRFO_06496 [Tritrichomonas foetus]